LKVRRPGLNVPCRKGEGFPVQQRSRAAGNLGYRVRYKLGYNGSTAEEKYQLNQCGG
jgi:hypothetical protein